MIVACVLLQVVATLCAPCTCQGSAWERQFGSARVSESGSTDGTDARCAICEASDQMTSLDRNRPAVGPTEVVAVTTRCPVTTGEDTIARRVALRPDDLPRSPGVFERQVMLE